MSASRRYEIFLPQKFNDGTPVPDQLLADTVLELRQRFRAVSCETQTIQGAWEHEGEVYRDDLIRVFVDVDDVPANREFFRQLKERLKTRFQQIEIWMTTYPVDVV
jgi:hypothetical protein